MIKSILLVSLILILGSTLTKSFAATYTVHIKINQQCQIDCRLQDVTSLVKVCFYDGSNLVCSTQSFSGYPPTNLTFILSGTYYLPAEMKVTIYLYCQGVLFSSTENTYTYDSGSGQTVFIWNCY
jgi:hypothetical protein